MNKPDNLTSQIAQVIDAAWPCFVHYADLTDLLSGSPDQALKDLLATLSTVTPTSERAYEATTRPLTSELAEDMAHGHEHLPACLALAEAITRCIPALAQTLTEDRWTGGPDQHAVRHALLGAHARNHRLDPACGSPDGAMVQALTSTGEPPLETGPNWRFMVRLTGEVMGGEEKAFDFMPMRCFTRLEQARNWSLVQAEWESLLLGDPSMLTDPGHREIVAKIESYDGTSERKWRLPSTNVDLHITPRPEGV